jgi:hypothetical protein
MSQHTALFVPPRTAAPPDPPASTSTLTPEPSLLITCADLERRLHVSSHHRRELERYGLPVYKLSPHVRRYDLKAVEAWLAARLQQEGEPI